MKKIFLTCLFFLSFFVFASPSLAAKVYLDPLNRSSFRDEEFKINLNLDTQGKTLNAVDVALVYPQDILKVLDVDFSSAFTLHLERILENEGKVILNFSSSTGTARFNGQGWLATLTLKGLRRGQGYLAFVCNNLNNREDTNLWQAETGEDVVDCSLLERGNYEIQPLSSSPSPSPACVVPVAPSGLSGQSGPGVGQATLSWQAVENADYYTISYGLVSGGYIYGAPNIGKGTSFTVSKLAPGRRYYFVLTSVNSCGSSGFSTEVSVRAGGSLPASTSKGGLASPPASAIPEELLPSPSVVEISPLPVVEPSALPTEEASASPAATLEPIASESPAPAFIPEKPPAFWQKGDFWKNVGIVAASIFILLLIFNFLRGQKEEFFTKKFTPEPPKKEEVKPEEVSWSPPEEASWPPEEWPPPSK